MQLAHAVAMRSIVQETISWFGCVCGRHTTQARKELASPRVDFIAMIIKFCVKNKIKYCSAPFESDWQIVALQQQGLIKHIISSDGDLFVLGDDSIITNINYSSRVCCVYNRESILQRTSMGGGLFFKRDLPLLSCLAGNDYIDHLYLYGHKNKRVLQLMQQFISLETQEDKESFIADLEQNSKWKREQKGNCRVLGWWDIRFHPATSK